MNQVSYKGALCWRECPGFCDDLLDFFRHLPNGDRQYVILPNTAHNQVFSKKRQLLWYAMENFLAAPTPVAS
jgi:hypothetical protein